MNNSRFGSRLTPCQAKASANRSLISKNIVLQLLIVRPTFSTYITWMNGVQTINRFHGGTGGSRGERNRSITPSDARLVDCQSDVRRRREAINNGFVQYRTVQ